VLKCGKGEGGWLDTTLDDIRIYFNDKCDQVLCSKS